MTATQANMDRDTYLVYGSWMIDTYLSIFLSQVCRVSDFPARGLSLRWMAFPGRLLINLDLLTTPELGSVMQ